MDIRKVDLNLLVVFDTLIDQRSVTHAAEELAISQPATSAALARLRRLFDDPLFVKTGPAMQPTPRALELALPIRRVIALLQEEVLQAPAFDPRRSDKTFNLIAPDIAELILTPRLLARLQADAPGVRLRVASMPRHAAAEALATGSAELALGYFPDLHKSGFFQQLLFRHRYVSIVRTGHPEIGRRLGIRQYLAARHAVVTPEGREHLVERFLVGKKIHRNVVLELSHFTSLLSIIAKSDLVATVPSDLADFFALQGGIRIVEPPFRMPTVEVHQFWHQRLHKDAGHIWLRALVHETLRD